MADFDLPMAPAMFAVADSMCAKLRYALEPSVLLRCCAVCVPSCCSMCAKLCCCATLATTRKSARCDSASMPDGRAVRKRWGRDRDRGSRTIPEALGTGSRQGIKKVATGDHDRGSRGSSGDNNSGLQQI